MKSETDNPRTDFQAAMSYGDCLQLDQILSAQKPRSPDHNEMLSIAQHQPSELWMKPMLHESHAAIRAVAADELPDAFKMLARVSRVMEQPVHAWDMLDTMTPAEYSAMRPCLASWSRFQTHQYRCIEFALGNKNKGMLAPHAHRPDLQAQVRTTLLAPPLYDEAPQLLAHRGLDAPPLHLARDWSEPYPVSEAVEQAWPVVYRDPKRFWDLYQLGKELTDLEDAFGLWRFRHVTAVERLIGFRRGTGGTGSVSHLRHMPDVVLFPEIWQLRTRF